MPARRFFIEGTHANGDLIAIGGNDAHKIVRVLRLKTGDSVELVDSSATVFDAELAIDGERVEAMLRDGRASAGSSIRIDVAQGVPKGQKMDFIVEKLSELGVASILPFESERGIVRDAGAAKIERWRRLAQTAAQQSGRTTVARIEDVLSYDELIERFGSYDAVLFPWEVAERQSLRDVLPPLVAGARSILLVVGPEGGFSHEEASRAARASATIVSLGTQILRTETAALFAVSILRYLTE